MLRRPYIHAWISNHFEQEPISLADSANFYFFQPWSRYEIEMFELPTKFTGIQNDVLSYEKFKELCYSLQGLGEIRVTEVKIHKYPNNYYEAVVNDDTDNFSIIQNCYVNYLCFRVAKDEENIYYLDKPNIALQIANLDSGAIVLNSEILTTPIAEYHMAKLSSSEKKEVEYWLPETIGGVMFSWYFD